MRGMKPFQLNHNKTKKNQVTTNPIIIYKLIMVLECNEANIYIPIGIKQDSSKKKKKNVEHVVIKNKI